MRWYEISDDQAALMAERRRQGDSWVEVGKEFGLERRAVAKVVKQFEEKQSQRAVIRREVLAQSFKDHLSDMEKAAKVLLNLTAAPSVRDTLVPSSLEIEPSLVARLRGGLLYSGGIALGPSNGHPPERYLRVPGMTEADKAQLELEERIEARMADHRARATVEALNQHVTNLWRQVAKWEQVAKEYDQSWKELVRQAAKVGIRPESVESVVKIALGWSPDSDEWKKEERAHSAPDIAKRLLRTPGLFLFRESLAELESMSNKLEEMLSPANLRKTLVTGTCRYCPI